MARPTVGVSRTAPPPGSATNCPDNVRLGPTLGRWPSATCGRLMNAIDWMNLNCGTYDSLPPFSRSPANESLCSLANRVAPSKHRNVPQLGLKHELLQLAQFHWWFVQYYQKVYCLHHGPNVLHFLMTFRRLAIKHCHVGSLDIYLWNRVDNARSFYCSSKVNSKISEP